MKKSFIASVVLMLFGAFAAFCASDKKTLVAYFSAQSHTEKVAKTIAGALNADIFEIVPKDDYASADLDWTDEKSRVCIEHKNNVDAVELVSTTVKDWDSYDTVFIGYPIWWGNAAWPLGGFIKANDFTGKTVIPFATSISSAMSNSGRNLAKMAGEGTWQEGRRFQSNVSSATVEAWVKGLKF